MWMKISSENAQKRNNNGRELQWEAGCLERVQKWANNNYLEQTYPTLIASFQRDFHASIITS